MKPNRPLPQKSATFGPAVKLEVRTWTRVSVIKSEIEVPQARYNDRRIVRVEKWPKKFTPVFERVDLPVFDVADQESIAELAEV